MNDRKAAWIRLEPLLDRALELDPAEWPAFLERTCGEDRDLRGELETLLLRRSRLEGFLESLPVAPEPSLEGAAIGPYRIARLLGQGGMGQVFLAERADGLFERRVALKLLHPFVQHEEALARFESERRILASLDHPGIARLLDAGLTPDGRPYLVTEYVEGRPIHSHAWEGRLPLLRRLDLFCQVADAVGHAHRNLLVHRDLKPSNILVTPRGRVKLLDFGIAKILDDPARGALPPSTGTNRRWMTPGYAAPEQIEGGPVTTVTDVYQMGVLLFELLSGQPPFAGEGRSVHGLERAVLDVDPPPPSRALGPRGTPDLRGRFRMDLDAIVLKALRKQPQDRYASVEALVDDLDRCLASRPVEARAGDRMYRLRRFVRRRKVESAAAAAVLLALAGGAGIAAWQAGEARKERDEARAQTIRAEMALTGAQEVTDLLVGLFQSADPWEGRLRNPEAARELLRLAGLQLPALEGQTRIQTGLFEALAQVHLALNQHTEARELASRAVELRREAAPRDDPALARSLNVLGTVLKAQGRYGAAQMLHEEALALQTHHLGGTHPEVARTLDLLAARRATENLAESEALRRRALEIRRASLGPAHPLTLQSLRALGRLERVRGHPDRAEAYLTEALKLLTEGLGPTHPEVARAKLNLADLIRAYEDDDGRAEELYRSALEIQRAAHGDAYPGLTHGMESLAYIHSSRGDHVTAERLLRESLDLRGRIFGPRDPAVAEGMGFLAMELHRQGRLGEAEALRRQEAALWKSTRGPSDWNLAGALVNLAHVRVDQGLLDEAEALYREALSIRIASRGERNGAVAVLHGSLGRLYALQGNTEQAERSYVRALEILLEERTEAHPDVRRIRTELAGLRATLGGSAEDA